MRDHGRNGMSPAFLVSHLSGSEVKGHSVFLENVEPEEEPDIDGYDNHLKVQERYVG